VSKMRRCGILLLALVLVLALVSACAGAEPTPEATPPTEATPAPTKVIHWDFSFWSTPRPPTYTFEEWAKAMNEATDGRWEIKLHYGETLAPAKEGLDGIKAGMFEGAFVAAMYHVGKTPLLSITTLPFLAPEERAKNNEWQLAIAQHPLIDKELESWNAQMLFPALIGQYQLMGKVPIRTVDDFKGVRVRIDPVTGKVFEKFGAVSTLVTVPEIYDALQRGMLDTVCWITPSFLASKIYELAKYYNDDINVRNGTLHVVVSRTAWDSLPQEFKEQHQKWMANHMEISANFVAQDEQKAVGVFKEAGVEFIHFEDRDELVVVADEVWQDWVKDMQERGLPGEEFLEFAKSIR